MPLATAPTVPRRSTVLRAARVVPPPPSIGPAASLQPKVREAAALLKALANPDRLQLLCQLVEAERNVGELGALSGIGQPSLSQQLSVLRAEGLVATRREGRYVLYRVASPAALAVLQTLHSLYCQPAPAAAGAGRRTASSSRQGRKASA